MNLSVNEWANQVNRQSVTRLNNQFNSFVVIQTVKLPFDSPSGDGYITTQTLKEILRELDNKLSEEDLDGIIDEIDEDGSGTVDFDGE